MFTNEEVQDIVAGALYCIMGELSALKEPVTFSEKHWARPAVDILINFAEKHNLSLNNPQIENWDKLICQK